MKDGPDGRTSNDLAARHMGMPESDELTRRCEIAAEALLGLREDGD